MGIFPEAEDDGCEPFGSLAQHLGCHECDVHAAFRGVEVPEWNIPAHLSEVKATTHALNTAARHAKNLYQALGSLDESERADLLVAGCVTIHQVEHLLFVLTGNANGLQDWLKGRNRQGGRNPAAYAVGEGVRRLFRRSRRNITYGLSASGEPSTDFCRAVEFGLGAFGIKADWRGPARAAHDRQLGISNRHFQILRRCEQQRMQTQ